MLNIISQQVRLGRNSGDLSRPGYVDKNYLRSKAVRLFSKKLDESTLRYKSKNQKIIEEEIFEPMKGRGLEQFQFSPGVSSKTSESSSICFSCSDLENNKPQAKVHGIQDKMGDGCIETELSQCVLKSTNSNPASGYAFADTLANSDQQSESNPVNLSMEDGHPSYYFQEALSGEASLKEISHKKSDFLNFSNIRQPQFQDYFVETNQQSPNSVLEPFHSQNPSTIECFKSLLLQLQDFDFESVETCYEGSVIMSDDDDFTEGFLDISCNDNAIQWLSGDIESRNFSYMVDVLDEAGFYSKKSFTDLEFPICPLVFKSLEKKYGKQTYWLKFERHLLFDRINSALLNILNLIINFQACEISVQKWFSSAWRRDKVEDELWNLLMNELKEENGNLSEKAVGRRIKWLELEEDIGIICRELENCLFDELVMELGTLWD